MSATAAPLSMTTLAPIAESSLAKKALLVVGGAAFLAGLSKIAVGFPVAMTLQTLAVMVIGLTMGARLGGATIVTYLAAGLFLPVFSKPAAFGLAYMLGGTGGFLLGFLALALIVGTLADRGFTRSWLGTYIALVIGIAAVFALGVAWLTNLYGFEKAIAWGVTPFLISEPIKIVLAGLVGKGVLKGASALRGL